MLGPAAPRASAFELDDYFAVRQVGELALSPDGTRVAYVTAQASGNRQVFVCDVARLRHCLEPQELQGANGFQWVSKTRLMYLVSGNDGVTEILAWSIGSREVRQEVRAAYPIRRFKAAAEGNLIAYVTGAYRAGEESLYRQFRNGHRGILIDADRVSLYDFVDPRPQENRLAVETLWIVRHGEKPFAVPVPGNTDISFHWSSDAGFLSVLYASGTHLTDSLMRGTGESIGVFDLASRRFEVLADANDEASYGGGQWIDGEKKLFMLRYRGDVPRWVAPHFPDLGIIDSRRRFKDRDVAWQPIELYAPAKISPISAERFFVETTRKGVAGLFELDRTGAMRLLPWAGNLTGSNRLFSLSEGYDKSVFVNESLVAPPEIYFAGGAGRLEQLTHLNTRMRRKVDFSRREIRWAGRDGASVSGWLLEPLHAGGGPLPTLTYVHGGPAKPYIDRFAANFRTWPYPFEVLASYGIAVFIPNYRGTMTYGRRFAWPSRLDAEPLDDIIAGVEHLVGRGVADPARLGIAGHSHGGWLGPLAMIRSRMFAAGSFAEGTPNSMVLYELMPGNLNRAVHDIAFGGGKSLYESPQRYFEMSPDLNFEPVSTPTLFEAGAYSVAALMTAFPKAARHAGAPTEYVVYPNTSHNIDLAPLLRESAARNTDWFRFWLQSKVEPDPAKHEQYARWAKMIRTSK